MGPTKAIVNDGALYEFRTGKLIRQTLKTHQEIQDYASHHYLVLPVVDK